MSRKNKLMAAEVTILRHLLYNNDLFDPHNVTQALHIHFDKVINLNMQITTMALFNHEYYFF